MRRQWNGVDCRPTHRRHSAILPRSTNCNPHAERFIRYVREECTDRILLFDRGHAEKIFRDGAVMLTEMRA